MSPRVSIVIATYNRHRVLAHAIDSMRRLTFHDWEALVIGDGCTDETAATVAAFADPRISFENLPGNSGGQATPNNRGIERARGEYIAFLNNDDLYLPHHLAACVEALDCGDADLVWVPALVVREVSSPDDPVTRAATRRGAGRRELRRSRSTRRRRGRCDAAWLARGTLARGADSSRRHGGSTRVASGARLQFAGARGRGGCVQRRAARSSRGPTWTTISGAVAARDGRLTRMIEDRRIHGASSGVHAMFLHRWGHAARARASVVQADGDDGLHPLSVNMMLWYRRRGGPSGTGVHGRHHSPSRLPGPIGP